jgi:V/A-type H+/Na+-transporting ATPase subunit I
MVKVRVLGPRPALPPVLDALQDLGLVHLTDARGRAGALAAFEPDVERERQGRRLRHVLDRLDGALAALRAPVAEARTTGTEPIDQHRIARWSRLAGSVLRQATTERSAIAALEEERDLLVKYRELFRVFAGALEPAAGWNETVAYPVVLSSREEGSVGTLKRALAGVLGEAFEVVGRRLPSGEMALVILVPAGAAARVEAELARARVQEIPLPAGLAEKGPAGAAEAIRVRLERLTTELARRGDALSALGQRYAPELRRARAAVADRVEEHRARALAGATAHAFVLEGWLPERALPGMQEALRTACGVDVVVEQVSREEWRGEEAPVVLQNPRLFRPFELLIGVLPLPRYGTIDPTPFVAVFFPMFFGMILGDAGYGVLLALLALVLHRRSRPGTTLRAVSEVAGACAAFAIIFGALFGELFGDLGARWFGLRPILFNREEALLPFLGLAIALGLVHILLGLVLAVISRLRAGSHREAVGPGVTAAIIVLIVLAILAAVDVLPRGFFTPLAIALLVAFPVLVVAEGLLAPMELLSTLGHILSYARVMAIGTASVMLAVVANRMVGTLGSVVVGALFALIFHLVNFALGLFSPTIHALRLHYVEFFGTFYSPGGVRYEPFGHWKPPAGRAAA